LLFIITSLAYGGAETQLVRLATRLKARGWEVRVVSLLPPRAYVEELEATGIPVLSLGIRRKMPDPRPILQLARLIREWRPHIVHSYMVHANLLARLVRLMVPVPILVCSARNVKERNRLRELLYRLTDPLCDLTTQVCQARHKIRYIPNGVDTAHFKPDSETRVALRRGLGLENLFVWLAVGRFDPPKDHLNLVRAFARVVAEEPNTALLIAGDGPLRPSVEELVRELRLEGSVRFLGIRRDMPQLMNAADAYVMSSAWEGMANVLLEASATGLPIVATDVGGNGEIVLDGETGFLVPPKDPGKLAQAMLRLMSLPQEERKSMGEKARRYVEDNFALEQIVEHWHYWAWLCGLAFGHRVLPAWLQSLWH